MRLEHRLCWRTAVIALALGSRVTLRYIPLLRRLSWGGELIGHIRSVLLLISVVSVASGCAGGNFNLSPATYGFSGHLATFDVVPPSWITADGKAGASQSDSDDATTAYVFPSRYASDPDEQDGLNGQRIPDILGNNAFDDGTYQFTPGYGQMIRIDTRRSGQDLLISIDGGSLTRIRRLDLTSFRALQGGYLRWLSAHSLCWPTLCFTDALERGLRTFWKEEVLGPSAQFTSFASSHLNSGSNGVAADRPERILYDTGTGLVSMWATRVYPGQDLSITWGNQNLNVESPPAQGSTVNLATSYSRTTSGGNTRLQIVHEGGTTRLFPAANCGAYEVNEAQPSVDPAKVLVPYSNKMANQLGTSFIPIYNLFDLHNPKLLAGVPATAMSACPSGAPHFLFLLTPSEYTKPDVFGGIAQFETEGQTGGDVTGHSPYKSLFRQFVILGCDSDLKTDIESEWKRFLDAARGEPVSAVGRCGVFVHGVFSGKTFVERRTHVIINGIPVDGGLASYTTIAQAAAPTLGVRMNMRSPPDAAALVELWRTPFGQPENADPKRLHIRFYTTMSGVLEKATVIEGDDIHVKSISEVLR